MFLLLLNSVHQYPSIGSRLASRVNSTQLPQLLSSKVSFQLAHPPPSWATILKSIKDAVSEWLRSLKSTVTNRYPILGPFCSSYRYSTWVRPRTFDVPASSCLYFFCLLAPLFYLLFTTIYLSTSFMAEQWGVVLLWPEPIIHWKSNSNLTVWSFHLIIDTVLSVASPPHLTQQTPWHQLLTTTVSCGLIVLYCLFPSTSSLTQLLTQEIRVVHPAGKQSKYPFRGEQDNKFPGDT